MFYFYIFRCNDGALYCGSTNELIQRQNRHNAGLGARYTKIHGGGKMVYSEKFTTLTEAMRRETQVKKWSRIKKDNLINGIKPLGLRHSG
ncbi:MAG TPA: GIY-YIG nuclease family protein [Patescibacteria group bacterium]|nr:GIY-YIG nuclease family protein [Patescibacteria group bacterium]